MGAGGAEGRAQSELSVSKVLVGIDTGGTFTDLVAVDTASGRHCYHKVPTQTDDPARGILEGIAEILDANRLARGNVALLVLGTTLATNAVPIAAGFVVFDDSASMPRVAQALARFASTSVSTASAFGSWS